MVRAVVVSTAVVVLTLARFAQSGAQEVRGTVRDSASRQPVLGAVVTLLDASGNTLGRNITDQSGRYRVVVTATTTQLRFLRIGFRPVTVPLHRTGRAVDTADVLMTVLPTLLEPMTVTANGCPRRGDVAQAFGLLVQARASLLNSVVARESNPGTAARIRFRRVLDGIGDRVLTQFVTLDSNARADAPFVSVRSASQFVHDGFIKEDPDGRVYYAPDAEALLDDAFIDGYCLRLVRPDREHRTEVGLGFVARKHERNRVDIDGVLWVDTTQRQLRRLEFQYVGLDRSLQPAKPGGQISYRDMANGVVIIDRWSLRLPVVIDGQLAAQETGGEVSRISWATGLTWDDPLGTLQLTARTHGHNPAAGTLVQLENTDYAGRVDARGEVTIRRLLPGPYNLVIVDTLLRPLGITLPTPVKFEAARDSTHRATLEVTTTQDYLRDRCRHDGIWNQFMLRRRPGDVWMIGRVAGPDGAWIADAKAAVSQGSRAKRAREESSPSALLDSDEQTTSRPTGTDGIFTLCQGRFTVGDSIIVGIYVRGSMTVAFPSALEDSLTVLPIVRVPKQP